MAQTELDTLASAPGVGSSTSPTAGDSQGKVGGQQMISLRSRTRASGNAGQTSVSAKESLKQTAANVLMQLSVDDDNKKAVREAGGLKRLVALLGSPDSDVQLNVLGALTNLALNDENKEAIRELQAIPKILSLLDTKDENVQAKVIEVLWNLAGNDENRVAILYAGGVKRLLDMVPLDQDIIGRSSGVVAGALGALANLSAHPENQLAIRDGEGISKVVNILVGGATPLMKERAANCMENLALDRENRQKIRSLGGTATLVELLARPPITSEAAAAGALSTDSTANLTRAVIGALKNLSVDEENKGEIARSGGVPHMVALLSSSDSATRGKAAECLGNFALEDEFRSQVRELDAMGNLVQLLDEPGRSEEACLAAVGALLNLAVEDECKLAIRKLDGIKKLVDLLGPHVDRKLRALAAMTLTNLAAQDESAIAIAEAEGVTALIKCMEKDTDIVLQEKAASALWNLSAVTSLKTAIRKAGGIPNILSVLEFTTFVPAIENCLGVLLSLAETQENRFAIAQAGAVRLLIRLLDNEDSSVVQRAAGVIWNLAHEETVQHTVRQLEGMRSIIGLLQRDSPLIRFNVVGSLPLLTECSENIKEACSHGIIPPLVGFLATETNVLLLQNTAQTLGNIAECSEDYQKEIGAAQGVERLVDVLARWAPSAAPVVPASAETPLGSGAAKAPVEASAATTGRNPSESNTQELLAKLCFAVWLVCQRNEVNQSAFCEAGGFASLVRVLGPDNEETILEMAAGACCALCEACPANRDRFREEKGLEPLLRLLNHPTDSVKLNAAKALAHLAENGENRRIIHELKGVEQLVKLLSS